MSTIVTDPGRAARHLPADRRLHRAAQAGHLQAGRAQHPAPQSADDPDRDRPDAEHADHLVRARHRRYARLLDAQIRLRPARPGRSDHRLQRPRRGGYASPATTSRSRQFGDGRDRARRQFECRRRSCRSSIRPSPAINDQTQLAELESPSPVSTQPGSRPFGGIKSIDGSRSTSAPSRQDTVVVSEALRGLELKVGDTFTAYVSEQPTELTVAAIARNSALLGFGNNPDGTTNSSAFAMALPQAQALLDHPGELNSIFVTHDRRRASSRRTRIEDVNRSGRKLAGRIRTRHQHGQGRFPRRRRRHQHRSSRALPGPRSLLDRGRHPADRADLHDAGGRAAARDGHGPRGRRSAGSADPAIRRRRAPATRSLPAWSARRWASRRPSAWPRC